MKDNLKQRIIIIIHTILLILVSLILIVYPMYLSDFIDNTSDIDMLKKISLIIIILFFTKNIFKYCDVLLQNYLKNIMEYNIKKQISKKILYVNYLRFVKIDSGKLININNDVENVINFYINFISILVKDMLLMIGIIYIAFQKISYIPFIFVFMILILVYLFQKVKINSVYKVKNTKESFDRMITLFSETFHIIEEFYFIKKDNFLINRLRRTIKIFFKNEVVSNFISYEYWISSLFVFGCMKLIILTIGIFLISKDMISLGSIYLFIYYIDMMEDPIMDMRLQLETLPNIEESKNRIKEIMSLETNELSYGDICFDGEIKEIELCNISFSYAENYIFKNFNLKLYPKTYVMSSPSGTGKSTLINLLARLFDVSNGTIKYNGIDIREIKKGELSRKIEYIDQRIVAKSGEFIKDIIGNGEKTKNLMKLFKIDKTLDSDTLELSDGEFKTLFLIKTLLSNKDILILDEVFLGIDDYKCNLFFDLLKNLNKIVIIISHEARIIDKADEVINIGNN